MKFLKLAVRNLFRAALYLFIFGIISCTDNQNLPDPLAAGWQGQSVCEILQDNDKIRVLKCTFPPGVGHIRHFHPPHMAYTLAGSTFRMTDTTGVRTVEVPTGLHYYSEGVEWHEALNVGDSTAVFLIIEPK